MNKTELIEKTMEYVKSNMSGGDSGHDWFHVERVWRMAKRIGEEEDVELFIVEMGALLHDIADWKFHGEEAGPKKAKIWMESIHVDENDINEILSIIANTSFRGSAESERPLTLAGKVVQDADRLDALGAIGIARCFSFGGFRKNVMHDPETKPNKNMSWDQYKKSNTTSINHFYEKLLLLKDRMNTSAGKRIAKERHIFMEKYLEQFFKEWKSED